MFCYIFATCRYVFAVFGVRTTDRIGKVLRFEQVRFGIGTRDGRTWTNGTDGRDGTDGHGQTGRTDGPDGTDGRKPQVPRNVGSGNAVFV